MLKDANNTMSFDFYSEGAGEARQALLRSSSKAEKTAAAAVRGAEERQRAAEEELSSKTRALSKQLEDTKADLEAKNKLLKARANAAVNEATALRAELKKERERTEAAEKGEAWAKQGHDKEMARLKGLVVEAKHAREEAIDGRDDALKEVERVRRETRAEGEAAILEERETSARAAVEHDDDRRRWIQHIDALGVVMRQTLQVRGFTLNPKP